MYTLAIIGVLSAVVGAFYYLRIVKIMYFDDPAQPFEPASSELRFLIIATSLITLFFFINPTPILIEAELAAASLLP